MTVARQVYAKGLQAKLKPTEAVLQALATRAALFGGASANDDVLSYAPSSYYASSGIGSHDATSLRISGNAIGAVARMLVLTAYQRHALERAATSVTANGYCAVEGSDALIVFAGEREAARTLHELGFARVREASELLPDRFYKVVASSNGAPSTAWARLEWSNGRDALYVHIAVIASA